MNGNKKSRWLAGLIVGVMALGACSTGDQTDPDVEEGAPPTDGEERIITIWHTESTPRTMQGMDEIIAVFEADNPGYRVVQENVAWGDLQVKLQASLSAGDLPELTHVEPMFVRTLYEQDLLRELDEVVESVGDDYIPELKRMFELEDGHHYGVVHAWGTDLTVYRKDHYEAAGVDPHAVSTWDDFLEQLKAVDEANPDAYALTLAGAVAHNTQEEIQMWLGSNGGSLFDSDGNPTLNTPQMKEVLEYWRTLSDEGLLEPGWSSAAYNDTSSNIALGNASTVFAFGRVTYTFEEQNPAIIEEDLVGVVADKPVGPSGTDWITQLDAEPFVAFKDAENSDMAVEFLKTFYEHDNYLKWIGSVPTQLLPIQSSMFEDPDYLALPEMEHWDFWIETQRDVLQSGKAHPLMITNPEELKLPYVSDLYGSGIIHDMVMNVVEEGGDIDEAMAEAQRRAEELLSNR